MYNTQHRPCRFLLHCYTYCTVMRRKTRVWRSLGFMKVSDVRYWPVTVERPNGKQHTCLCIHTVKTSRKNVRARFCGRGWGMINWLRCKWNIIKSYIPHANKHDKWMWLKSNIITLEYSTPITFSVHTINLFRKNISYDVKSRRMTEY